MASRDRVQGFDVRHLPALLAVASLVAASIGGAMVVASTYAQDPTPATGGDTATTYSELHAAGVTGANVSVGIIEPTGFDLDALDGDIAAARAFGNGKTLVNGGQHTHGTAVAQTIGNVAPDSDRYLAAFADEADFRAAVDWMAAQDVDVVVVPASFFGKPGDGSAWSARAVHRLARDTVVVAAAGNTGTGSWHGHLTPGADDGSRLVNPEQEEPATLEVSGGRTEVWLSWRNPDARYTLRLVQNGTTIATSMPYPDDSVPNELLTARLESGTYEVVVEQHGNASSDTVRVETPTDRFYPTQPAGSLVAPATARGILVVGAFDRSAGRVPAYSSRGPTLDARTGVDLVAPATPISGVDGTDPGTSYAAARTAGVAALLRSLDGKHPPHVVETTLEQTAWDLGPTGRDAASGAGLLRPGHAVARLRERG